MASLATLSRSTSKGTPKPSISCRGAAARRSLRHVHRVLHPSPPCCLCAQLLLRQRCVLTCTSPLDASASIRSACLPCSCRCQPSPFFVRLSCASFHFSPPRPPPLLLFRRPCNGSARRPPLALPTWPLRRSRSRFSVDFRRRSSVSSWSARPCRRCAPPQGQRGRWMARRRGRRSGHNSTTRDPRHKTLSQTRSGAVPCTSFLEVRAPCQAVQQSKI